MSEEEEKEAKRKAEEEAKKGTEQSPEGDPGKGNKYETTPVIERAREEREKLEAAMKEMREENDRREKIMSRQVLGGGSEAGQGDPPKETEDEKWAREAKVRYAGTGMDPTPDDGKTE